MACIDEIGEDEVKQFFLGINDGEGGGGIVAEGEELLRLALAEQAPA